MGINSTYLLASVYALGMVIVTNMLQSLLPLRNLMQTVPDQVIFIVDNWVKQQYLFCASLVWLCVQNLSTNPARCTACTKLMSSDFPAK